MINLIRAYGKVERHILLVIIAEAFIQLVNASFFIALLIYMDKEGYADHESTSFFKYRFLGVLALAYPLGLFIRGRRIMPFFYVAALGVPAAAFAIIYAIDYHVDWLLYLAQILWGIFFMCMQVSILPYIMRNASKETRTEAISMSFSTWSLTTIVAGILIFTLQSIDADLFSEKLLLQIIAGISVFGVFFLMRVKATEELNSPNPMTGKIYEWRLIFKALLPTLLIAIGAGLTIPFISLFFYNVHGYDTDQVSLVTATATVIVFFAILLVPTVKQKFGYKHAIPLTQMVAILMLVGLATTQYYSHFAWAGIIAALFYICRQPLMNMAGPMTSELTMNYVGKENQELVSALTASIWSGSWFVSALIFQVLRTWDIAYVTIFLITAGLYSVGVLAYWFLILDYEKRKAEGLVE